MRQLRVLVLSGCIVALSAAYHSAQANFAFTELDVPGGNNTIAYGINDAGQIVGRFASNTGVHGFLYSGGIFNPVDVPGGTFTEAYGINNSNQIVGFYQVDGSGQFAFVNTSGSFTQIQVGPTYTLARGINDSGAIVGYRNDILGQHGFLDKGGTITTFDVPGAAVPGYTRAYGINDRGQIVGYFFADGGDHGFVDSGGHFTQIDAPGALGSTQLFGINNRGDLVGNDFVDVDGVFTELQIPGASEVIAYGINDRGQVVGEFTDASGTHGFLATRVPEPPSIALLGIGLLALATLYRARLQA